MARPRIIKLPDGEVALKGFSKDRANEIATQLLGNQATIIVPEGKNLEEVEEEILNTLESEIKEDFQDIALGLRENKISKRWEVVTVGYNANTGSAAVLDVQNAGTIKNIAIEKFKVATVTKGLVRKV